MPGRMGAEERTVKNVWVYKIDPARNLIWVRGQVSISRIVLCECHWVYFLISRSRFVIFGVGLQVPGAEGNFVFIKDAYYKKPDVSKLPVPTHLTPEDEDPPELEPLVADLGEVDPFMLAG